MRLDIALHNFGFFDSREKAKMAIQNGKVFYKKQLLKKPSFNVENIEEFCKFIELDSEIFISRAAEKLKGFLDNKNIEFNNVLDVGSSTGGFAQILLEYGAKCVVCVDVGSNQLHKTLRENPKIILFENLDIRNFIEQFLLKKIIINDNKNFKFDFLTCDVSFISLSLIISQILSLGIPRLLFLFKPQFEVGKNIKRNKKGVVLDEKAIINSLENFTQILKKSHEIIIEKSKILGKEGNAEYFIYASKK